MDPQEITCIEAVKSGDDTAYRELVERYQQALFGFCNSLLHDEAAAEDLVQETFIVAYRKIGRYDPAYKFSTWLFTIARRRGLNVIRQARRFVTTADVEELADTLDTSRATQETLDVRKAVMNLPARYRTVVELYYWQGLSYQDIADALGITVGNVKIQLVRAKEFLRKELV